MSVKNRVGGKIVASRLEIEMAIKMKLDDIKFDHMKNTESLDMKISTITSTKPSPSSEKPLNKFLHTLNNHPLIS